MSELNALEFYSGIGGLHLALSRSNVPVSVKKAFDWDQLAGEVYSTNFGPGIATKVDISTLTASFLKTLEATVWLLSPACQPYTVLNPSAKGELDPRAKSFLHLVQTDDAHPTHLLVENVGGFETSSTRNLLATRPAEFLLTPLQFGIPNSHRLFLSIIYQRTGPDEALRYIPGRGSSTWADRRGLVQSELDPIPDDDVHQIRDYLDPEPVEGYEIPDRVLLKWGRLFDIVLPSSRRTCCFTRGYTQLVERSGSILQMNEDEDVFVTTSVFDAFLRTHSTDGAVRTLDTLRLRYFSAEELLRLFCFTPSERPFTWPEGISRKSKYRLIGNSINVKVVEELIGFLFEEP
ncbi:S-adenosyl-L-methionine-dependent methyltransferase [Mycena filopes]|nr:S-adenosyl-L-methionine-dependent methyltransferase [Mycena filopes]